MQRVAGWRGAGLFLAERLGWRDRRGQQRLLLHIVFWLLIWPLGSTFAAYRWIMAESRMFRDTPPEKILGGVMATSLRMTAEFYAVGLLALLVTFLCFSAVEATRRGDPDRTDPFAMLAEPPAALLVFWAGTALVFPAVLRQPVLGAIQNASVASVTIGALVSAALAMAMLGFRIGRRRGAVVALVAAVLIGGIAVWLSRLPPPRPESGRRGIILLALDSTSVADGFSLLESYTARRGGTWYRRGVSPGLLTNSSWPAILQARSVQQTGVFMVFQSADWESAPVSLVEEARKRGYRTISWFTGQFTVFVGSEAGFEEDLSGPKGWLQIGTTGVKNSSLLLPLVLRALPRVPGAFTPPNQSGTFAYDLDADVRHALAQKREAPVFVAAHFDYLHAPTYPSYLQLSSAERRAVWRAPVRAIHDKSLDWQFPETAGDPVGVYDWKVRNLERAVTEALEVTRVTEPERGNRVAVFSDHGNRAGIGRLDFAKPVYYNVIFVTFGVPARDPGRAISLLDLGGMLGLAPSGSHEPVVAYTNIDGAEWQMLNETSEILLDGSVVVHPVVAARVGLRLTCFNPTSARGYWSCPAAPPPALLPLVGREPSPAWLEMIKEANETLRIRHLTAAATPVN